MLIKSLEYYKFISKFFSTVPIFAEFYFVQYFWQDYFFYKHISLPATIHVNLIIYKFLTPKGKNTHLHYQP